MRIIAYQSQLIDDKIRIDESTGESIESSNLVDLFSFLCEQYDDETLRVCWDIDSFAAPIIRLIGKDRAVKLHKDRKLYAPPFNIFYMPEKIFTIRHIPTHHMANIYHLSQYFPDDSPPDSVENTQILGEALLIALRKMGIKPSKLTSPVAIYDDSIMKHSDLPTWMDMPKGAVEYSFACSGKLWIEAFMQGYFE